jgi:hypothetical protein
MPVSTVADPARLFQRAQNIVATLLPPMPAFHCVPFSTQPRALAAHPHAVWDTLSFASNGLVFFWAGVASINYLLR